MQGIGYLDSPFTGTPVASLGPTSGEKPIACIQSCKMSNLLHGPRSSNQILPREKRVNRDIFNRVE